MQKLKSVSIFLHRSRNDESLISQRIYKRNVKSSFLSILRTFILLTVNAKVTFKSGLKYAVNIIIQAVSINLKTNVTGLFSVALRSVMTLMYSQKVILKPIPFNLRMLANVNNNRKKQ